MGLAKPVPSIDRVAWLLGSGSGIRNCCASKGKHATDANTSSNSSVKKAPALVAESLDGLYYIRLQYTIVVHLTGIVPKILSLKS